MLVNCQQKDCIKIGQGIPGHGMQEPVGQRDGRVYLKCLCAFPISWLPESERLRVKTEVPHFKSKYKE